MITQPTILVCGRQGQLARELALTLAPLGQVIALGHAECDLTKPENIKKHTEALRPALIVNAAAYTAVDKAEKEVDLAHALNTQLPGVLAQEAKRLGVPLIHYSTDYVFDGTHTAPYLETDSTSPQSVYGQTKRAGELAIEASGAAFFIFRISWIYGTRGNNFFRTMLRLAKEREELKVVNDQLGSPTWSRMVAQATAQILAKGAPDWLNFVTEHTGIYHLTAQGHTSWFDFAKRIIDGSKEFQDTKCQRVVPISTAEYPTPANRPAYSVMNNTKAHKTFGVAMPPWETQLEAVLQEEFRT